MYWGFVGLGNQIKGQFLLRQGTTPKDADAGGGPTFRVYGPLGFMANSSGSATLKEPGSNAITNATNATPIVITSNNHGMTTGTQVTISGVGGNVLANGSWVVTVVDQNTFSLNGSAGNADPFSLSFVAASSQYVTTATGYIQAGSFTWSCWINLATLPGSNYKILSQGNNAVGTEIAITVDNNGHLNAMVDGVHTVTGTTVLSTATWYHLCLVYNASTPGSVLYLNAASELTDAHSAVYTADKFRAGANPATSPGNPFNGKIDDVRSYNRPLTSAEVTTLFSGANPSSTSLIVWWKFDEGSGSNAIDSSGSGNAGTLSNAPTYSSTVPAALVGTYTSGGTWHTSGLYELAITPTGANGYIQGTTYSVLVTAVVAGVTVADLHSFTVV